MTLRLRIERLGHRGDGVGAGSAGRVHAPFTLPGECVEGRLEGDRLPSPAILSAAPERVAPVCPHFGRCGGCALQHASDAFLADWKTEQVRAALAARGLDAPIRPIHVSPPGARRRVTLAARRRRRGVALGFHGRASHEIVPVDACPVARPEIVTALPALAMIAEAAASRKGVLRLSATATETGLDVDLDGAAPLDAARAARLAEAAAAADLARLTVGGETVAARRAPVIRFDGLAVVPPPGGFLQATADGEAALRAGVAEALADARRIADLFAGAGAFALPLARVAAVRAVEASAAALAALDAAARAAEGLKPIAAERRDLFRHPLAPAALAGVEGVAFDPPRAGARAQAEALAASTIPRVAAVSCNPATFGRDARILVDGGYRLLWVRPVDQFRWSPHVEIVAAFARR